jgi:sugar fermentation stimulation protein A
LSLPISNGKLLTMPVSHPIPGPLSAARFIRRYNRFLLQVRLEVTGSLTDAHMADPGRLRELLLPGKRLWLKPAANPGRKTRWTAVLVESPSGEELVSLDTTLPNRLVGKALQAGVLEEFRGWVLEKTEATIGRSRLDFLLSQGERRKMALEVKSVTLVEDGIALFPDAVTTRGARHVRELAEIAGEPDWEAAILFVLQRSDGRMIRAARSIDPDFADALEEAKAAGVRVLGRRCIVHRDKVVMGPRIPANSG